MPVIKLDGQTINYRVRRSQRARRLSIRYNAGVGLELVVPADRRWINGDAIMLKYKDWILRTHEKAGRLASCAAPRRYEHGAALPFLGQEHDILFQVSDSARQISISQSPNRFDVILPRTAIDDEVVIRDSFMELYRQSALDYLPSRVAKLAVLHGFRYGAVRIKNQKTRWGSCSAKGNLNFNLRLMMAPPAAIDYIILHELCHLRELNHSPRFWQQVQSVCPDYETWKRWFKANGRQLVF